MTLHPSLCLYPLQKAGGDCESLGSLVEMEEGGIPLTDVDTS